MLRLARRPIELREATVADLEAVFKLRKLHDRPFVGPITDIPVNLSWWVAVDGERVVACMGFALAPGRRMIISDLYDDGTRPGKRGLGALIQEGLHAGVKLYMNVPFDRPDLRKALERRGIVFKSWGGEYPA